MAIIDEATLETARRIGRKTSAFAKGTPGAGGYWVSLFRVYGTAAGAASQGAIPTAMAACDNTTVGALPLPLAVSGKGFRLTDSLISNVTVDNSFMFVDRLCASGGLDATLFSTEQTVGSVAISRGVLPDYSNVEWYLETYALLGATAVTATVTYTNHLDVTGKTTIVAIGASTQSNRLLEIIPLSGDFIKSIQSVNLSASTGTAGNFGVSAYVRVAPVGKGEAYQCFGNWPKLGAPLVQQAACLTLFSAANTAIVGNYVIAVG